jgi:hypothetical protein
LTQKINHNRFRSKYSKNYTIEGKKGGKIKESHKWIDENGNRMSLDAVLDIPQNAFKDTLTFDIIFDLENLSVELYPSPFTFDTPVFLDLKLEGIDLSEIDPEFLTFNYLSRDGSKEQVNFEKIKIDYNKKYLSVSKAELPHFSRYGWCR